MTSYLNESMQEIYPGLWLGNIKSSQNKELLTKHDITCIINCTVTGAFTDLASVQRKIRIAIKDNLDPVEIYKMYRSLDKAATAIYKFLPKHNILVHCYAGAQRSVAVVAAFFMKYTTLDKETILTCLKSKRPHSDGLNFDQALVHYACDLNRMRRE